MRPAVENSRPFVVVFAACASVLLAACTTPSRLDAPPTIGFVVVGDTGYSYAFLEPDDYAEPLTLEEFFAKQRAKWHEDGRPLGEFDPPPTYQLPNSGGFVAASGLLPVAAAMRTYCTAHDCAFGVMLGDNIYPDGATGGKDGRDSERFRTLFAEPFGALAQGKTDFRLYVTLGNHDWKTSRAGAQAQVDYLSQHVPFYMDGFFYRVTPAAANGEVEFFVLDTELLLAQVRLPEVSVSEDGTEIVLDEYEEVKPWLTEQTPAERNMAQWLDTALAASTARWKIVVGHHPLWSTSGSKMAQARALRRIILPTLCRYADLYLAGHEHTLELELDNCSRALPEANVQPLLEIVSGAGSKQRPSHRGLTAQQQADNPELTTVFAKGMVWGFAHLTLEADRAIVRLVSTPDDGSGRTIDEYTYSTPRRSGAGETSAAP